MACSKLNYDAVARDYGDVCWLETKIPAEDTRDLMRQCCPIGSKVLNTDAGCFSYCSIADEEKQREWASCITNEIEDTNFLGNFGGDVLCLFGGEEGDGGRELRVRVVKGDMAIAKAIQGILEVVETVVVSVPVRTKTSTSGQGSTASQQTTTTSKQSSSISQKFAASLYFAITNSSSVATNSSAVSNTTSILPSKSNTTLSNPSSLSNSTTVTSSLTTILPPPIYPNVTKPSPTNLIAGPVNTPAPVSTAAPIPHSTSVLHIPGTIANEGSLRRRVSVSSLFVLGLLVLGLL